MRAIALIRRRLILTSDAFVDIWIWRVPQPLPPSPHLFKYRLAHIVGGECVLRYDNERGKGDHRHMGEAESPYSFTTPDQLMIDFAGDIARWNDEHGRT